MQNFKLLETERNARIDALTAALSSGFLRLYDGVRPASPETAITTQTKLAEFSLPATVAPAASGGTTTFHAIPATHAVGFGLATWFRLVASDGVTALADGNVSTSGADLNLPVLQILLGAFIQINSVTITQP